MSTRKQHKPVYRFGEFTLDTRRGALLRNGEEIGLRPQSVVVLQVLLEDHGRLVEKDELHEKVWGRKAVTDDSLTQCIADIRRALGDTDRKLVRTLPRRGYMFDGEVSTRRPGRDTPGLAFSSPLLRFAALAVSVLALWFTWSSISAPKRSSSIAVLPLINMSAVADNTYFSEGIHEEILTNLSRVDDLRVISRTTMSRYLDLSRSTREIARELDVQYVVEGSVRRIDNHVRITVQLVDALKDEHIWAMNYDRELVDVFGTQSGVARDISNSIRLEIMPDSVGTLEKMPTESVRAYDLYMRANSIHRGEAISEDAYRRQRELLEAAVVEDPDFVEAWARLNEHLDEIARTIHQDEWFGETEAERDAYFARTRQAARRALDRAVALDPDNVATLVALGTDAISEFRDIEFRLKRKKYLDRALELDPDNAWTWYSLGWWGFDAGILDYATAAIRKALELDPWHAHIVGGSLSYFTSIGDRRMAALLEERYAVIAPERNKQGVFANLPGEVSDLPSAIKLSTLYQLFLYTAQDLMIRSLADAYSAEARDYIGLQGTPRTLDYWEAMLLVLQNDVEGVLELDLPRTPDDAGFEEVMHHIDIHNVVLAAQRFAGQSGPARDTARRILDLRARLDVDPATEEGFRAETATILALATTSEEGRMHDLYRLMRSNDRFPVRTWHPWHIFAYSYFDLDGAVEILLEKKAERPFWNGTDVIAASHITNRRLLGHPDVQAFYVAEDKWIDYLAARVPEYEQYRPR